MSHHPVKSTLPSTHRSAPSTRKRAPRAATVEALESRIAPATLLPGIGSGVHKTSVAFYDADGDRVDIAINGHGHFDVTLDGGKTNRANIDHLTIDDATASSTLGIRVLSNRGGGGTVTSGTTNINSITSDYSGTMFGINLMSVEVQDLDLGNVSLTGGVNLSVANALRADLLNQKALSAGGMQYEPVAPGLDLHNISLASAGSITISGAVGHADDPFSTNDFDGAINVTGSLGKLVGANSVLHGSVTAGTLGGVMVGQLHGSLASTGDMTLDLKTLNSDVTVDVRGDLHLRLGYANGNMADESGFFGTVNVGGNVSGIAPVKTAPSRPTLRPQGQDLPALEPISIRGNFAGQLHAGGNVADLSVVAGSGVTTGQFIGTLSSEQNIGNISAQRGFSGGSIGLMVEDGASVSANGSIGNITSFGTNSGSFHAGGNIGDISSTVTARSSDALAGATFVAQGSIGQITAKSFSGFALRNSHVESYGSDIGQTLAIVTNLTGHDAISQVSYTALQGTVSDILGSSAGGHGIDGLVVTADRVLQVTGIAGPSSFGDGLRNSSIVSSTTIGDVTGQAYGFSGSNGIDTLTLRANGGSNFQPNLTALSPNCGYSNGIGVIKGLTQGLGSGIAGLDAQSASGIAQIIGDAYLFHGGSGIANSTVADVGGNIGDISGSTGGAGSGISELTVSAAGRIASIVGTADNPLGQHGIASTNASADSIDRISGTSGGAAGADGIAHSSFSASSLGPVDAHGQGSGSSHGLDDATFTANSIGDVTADTNAYNVEAITNAHFNAPNVGLLTVQSWGDAGHHTISASTLGTDAQYFNYAGVHSNGSVDLTFDTVGAQGTLGSIDIAGNLDYAALGGVEHLGHFVVTGTVHGYVGNGATHTYDDDITTYSTASETIVIGSGPIFSNELGSDITFNFAHYDGTPNATVAGTDQSAGYSSAGVRLYSGV